MNNHSQPRPTQLQQTEDRRQNVLPSISSALHYPPRSRDDHFGMSKQSPTTAQTYNQSSMGHTIYDPVHDNYGSNHSPHASNRTSGAPYAPDNQYRTQRESVYSYNSQGQYNDGTTLPPIQHLHDSSTPHSPVLQSPSSGYASSRSAQEHSGGDVVYPYQTQAGHSPTSPSFQNQAASSSVPAVSEGTLSYMSLPPLTIPSDGASSIEGRSKRIVMACHQCRGRKIRCDALRPACSNCIRRHEDCQYDAKPKRRGPDKVPGSRMRSCKSRKQGLDETSPTSYD